MFAESWNGLTQANSPPESGGAAAPERSEERGGVVPLPDSEFVAGTARHCTPLSRRAMCFQPNLGGKLLLLCALACTVIAATLAASAPSQDRIAVLNEKLSQSAAHLQFTAESGYLLSVLEALNIPVESQVLVFSPTSSQAPLISPLNPRAIYFSDDVGVAWVRGGKALEVAAHGQQGGVNFYTLDQSLSENPQFNRGENCLTCHSSKDTGGVPGLLVRSTVGIDENGATRGVVTDHRTPYEERWGGWYVTGLARRFRHRGNRVGQGWLESLYDQFDTSGYPGMYSDIAALMVLEHQTQATNLMTRLKHEKTTQAIDEFVNYLLLIDEPPLPSLVISTSGYAQRFAETGPRDSRGRSLRQLDLKTRLFRYPCSYMIYSSAFDALPSEVRYAVYVRMKQVLHSRVPAADAEAVIEILQETKKEFAQLGGNS